MDGRHAPYHNTTDFRPAYKNIGITSEPSFSFPLLLARNTRCPLLISHLTKIILSQYMWKGRWGGGWGVGGHFTQIWWAYDSNLVRILSVLVSILMIQSGQKWKWQLKCGEMCKLRHDLIIIFHARAMYSFPSPWSLRHEPSTIYKILNDSFRCTELNNSMILTVCHGKDIHFGS